MDKCINFTEFMRYLLDDEGLVEKGAKIIKSRLEAQLPCLTNISGKTAGNSTSNYKVIQRFTKKVDLKKLLMRLYQEDAEFIIGDPTETPWVSRRAVRIRRLRKPEPLLPHGARIPTSEARSFSPLAY